MLACAANPKNSAKNLHHLSNTSSFGILCEIAKNPNTSIDTLREIQIDRLKNDSDEPAIKVKNFIDKRINEKITIAKEMEKQISEIPWLKNKTPNDSLKVLDDGTVIYFQNGVKHRDNGPAIVGADGSESWYQNGKLHRENAPAIIGRDGTEKWYLNGNPHREVGPAVLYPNGTRYYYQNGLLNRGNDKPAVVFPDGEKYWYQGGKLHRENKPAIVKPDGTQMYYKKGLLHRENGPAIQWDNGEQEYALQGFKIDKQEFDQKISLKKEISEIVKKEISPPSTEIKTSHRGRSL